MQTYDEHYKVKMALWFLVSWYSLRTIYTTVADVNSPLQSRLSPTYQTSAPTDYAVLVTTLTFIVKQNHVADLIAAKLLAMRFIYATLTAE